MNSPRAPISFSAAAPLTSAPHILFIDLAHRPGADQTVAAMARLGAKCAVLASTRSFAKRSRHAKAKFWLPRFAGGGLARHIFRARLRKVVREWRPDIVVPLDEAAARALRDPRLVAMAPAVRALIERSLGPEWSLPSRDPEDLLAMARNCGIETESGTETSPQILTRIVACAQGTVLDGMSFRTTQVDPRSGDGTVLQPVERRDIEAATRVLVAGLGCSGFLSLRFALTENVARLLSVDQGAPIAGPIGRLFGHDIHEALLDHVRGRPAPTPRPLAEGPATIALFPNELDRDPASRALNVPYVLHDMPWDDLAMMDIYAKWLHRRHPGSARQLSRHLPREGLPSALDLRKLVANLDRYP